MRPRGLKPAARRRKRIAAAAALIASAVFGAAARGDQGGGGDVRLVVLIVADQLRADFLTRWTPHFGDGGFRRLMREGAHFANAAFSYGTTATGPGHATIITGRQPREHGIVANGWFMDPGSTRARAAVSDESRRLVTQDGPSDGEGRSVHRLIGSGLGDQMKLSDARSRVFSVGLKDRGAILLGGRNPDGVLWWDLKTGRCVTSTYYGERLPVYAAEFNASRRADRFAGTTWEKLLPEAAYGGCHPVRAEWIIDDYDLGPAFPHALPGGDASPNATYYNALSASPFGNEVVLEVAGRILSDERLGADDSPDLLCIALSSNDYCGHVFGPESAEVLDCTVRTDRQLAAFLDRLDAAVGLRHCLVVLTGDHGVTTIPGQAAALRLGGGAFDREAVCEGLNAALRKQFGAPNGSPRYVAGIELPWLYFDPGLRGEDAARRRAWIDFAAEHVRKQVGVVEVFTADDLAGPAPSADDVARRLAWRSFHPQRSGELYLRLADYWDKAKDKTAGHTAGHSHDRMVPIVITGGNVTPGRYYTPADPADIAPTVAAVLGILPPIGATGRVLHEALATLIDSGQVMSRHRDSAR